MNKSPDMNTNAVAQRLSGLHQNLLKYCHQSLQISNMFVLAFTQEITSSQKSSKCWRLFSFLYVFARKK